LDATCHKTFDNWSRLAGKVLDSDVVENVLAVEEAG